MKLLVNLVFVFLFLFGFCLCYGDFKISHNTVRSNSQKKLLLTFDDGPNAVTSPKLLDIFRKYDISVVFFVVGVNLKGDEWDCGAHLRSVVHEGHWLGAHTYSHVHLNQETDLEKQIVSMETMFEESTGIRSYIFRPPYGELNTNNRNFISKRGYLDLRWSQDPKDYTLKDTSEVDRLADKIYTMGMRGGVMLCHEKKTTPAALEIAIPRLIKSGVQFAKLEEYLNDKQLLHFIQSYHCDDNTNPFLYNSLCDRLKKESYLRDPNNQIEDKEQNNNQVKKDQGTEASLLEKKDLEKISESLSSLNSEFEDLKSEITINQKTLKEVQETLEKSKMGILKEKEINRLESQKNSIFIVSIVFLLILSIILSIKIFMSRSPNNKLI
ncbi:chitin deacetylase 1-related [Anaeramoeba flamelloides]|uniref:Chitin deacetylase 1-related n=1 Tax=Anaeramoeba flamelloides TaxID=1746091 RepID=A0AAV7Y4M9_9EUKA|nr:chitin deacetylase 1-related [Anaeramoeba flamelloides]